MEQVEGVDLDVVRAALLPELEVTRLLGAGTAGVVYLAREEALGRQVAVKVLRPGFAEAEQRTAQRFEREARAAASLNHPNVVGVHRLGRLPDGRPYLVLQYVRGRSLADRMRAEGPWAAPAVRAVMVHIAAGLAAAHERGIVHRDVRPANVLWDTAAERALITDFGLAGLLEASESQAQLTMRGEVLGEVRYASPEQARGAQVTESGDVYSLGIVAYELLTGRVPHEGATRLELITARLAGTLPSFDDDVFRSDPGLTDLLRRCLCPQPEGRPDAATVARLASAPPPASAASFTLPIGEAVVAQLRRRRLPQFIGATAAAGWVLLEVVSQLSQHEVLPGTSYSFALVTVVWMLLAAAVVAWFHGERGSQRPEPREWLLLALLAAGWLLTIVVLLVT